MKKSNLFVSTFLMIALTFLLVGNAFAKTSNTNNLNNAKNKEVNTYVKLHSKDFPELLPKEKINIAPNKSSFYKIKKGENEYILEFNLTDATTSDATTTNASAITPASTENGYKQETVSVYSDVGVLNGTFNLIQKWQYNNGSYVYVPSPTISTSVPWYSWPNYWSNLVSYPPALNSQTKKYTSSGQGDLNISLPTPIGTVTFETVTAHATITFDAYGNASGSGYWD